MKFCTDCIYHTYHNSCVHVYSRVPPIGDCHFTCFEMRNPGTACGPDGALHTVLPPRKPKEPSKPSAVGGFLRKIWTGFCKLPGNMLRAIGYI
jgi:hypothetical protein